MIDDGTPRMSLRRGYVWVDLAASYRLTHAGPTPGTTQERSRIPAGLTLEATRSPAQEMLSTVPVGGAVRLTLEQVPPWIVVHPSVDDLMVTRWPGRLLEVAVDEPSDADEIAAAHEINVGFVPSARHRRVLAVRVLADLDPACLFGPGGRDIVALLDRAATLTAQDVGGRSFDAERLERARRSVVTALLGASSPLVHPGILASPNDALRPSATRCSPHTASSPVRPCSLAARTGRPTTMTRTTSTWSSTPPGGRRPTRCWRRCGA